MMMLNEVVLFQKLLLSIAHYLPSTTLSSSSLSSTTLSAPKYAGAIDGIDIAEANEELHELNCKATSKLQKTRHDLSAKYLVRLI